MYKVPGTPIRIAMSSANHDVPAGAESLGSVFGMGQSPNSEMMSPLLATGWSSDEKTGRWTEGEMVEFPTTYVKEAAGRITVCIDGYPFVSTADHIVSGRLLLNDRQVGEWIFKPGQQRACATDTIPFPAGSYLKPSLLLSGIRSPKEAGLSADTRRLGIFVTQLYIVTLCGLTSCRLTIKAFDPSLVGRRSLRERRLTCKDAVLGVDHIKQAQTVRPCPAGIWSKQLPGKS